MSEKAPKIPDMQPVDSSQVHSVGHDPDNNHLYVRFHGPKNNPAAPGPIYRYDGVTADKHAGLIGAESVGSHLHKNIKGLHPFTKIEEAKAE